MGRNWRGQRGSPTYNYYQAKKAGARFISIDRGYTATRRRMDADWYPISGCRPRALALGIMHALLEMDNPENPADRLGIPRRCTVGFERAICRQGADPKKKL